MRPRNRVVRFVAHRSARCLASRGPALFAASRLRPASSAPPAAADCHFRGPLAPGAVRRSEEHTSELQSLMRISYAVFCLKKKTYIYDNNTYYQYVKLH